MNGAVYISFFQGQLESVLEQVVQLAVQEISKTVGSSLNSMLLETAAKEQENQRLKVKLQSREGRATDNGSLVPSEDGRATDFAGRTKPDKQQDTHAPGYGTERGVPADTRRLEQKGRLVGQLKGVMAQVLDFAVRELTKIVEASFDDLLLEITKKERERRALEEHLWRSAVRGWGGGGGGGEVKGRGAGRRRGSEHDSPSPSDSEDAKERIAAATTESSERDDPNRSAVLSVAQDWVPILGKVFGQKWCSDVWQVKELDAGGGGPVPGMGGAPPGPRHVDLEPSPTSPQQDPRWTPLEDMEVLSPENDVVEAPKLTLNSAEMSSGQQSSASMLHRLLTLPAQLLEEEEAAAEEVSGGHEASLTETLTALATEGTNGFPGNAAEPPVRICLFSRTSGQGAEPEEEEEEEEEGEEPAEGDKAKKKKRRRVWLECEECGRRFSRASHLKTHRQAHTAENVATEESPSPSSSSSTTATAATVSPPLGSQCSECGKRFTLATRLHGHMRTHHSGKHS